MRNGRRAQHHRRTGDGKQTADGGVEVHAGIMPVRRTGRKDGLDWRIRKRLRNMRVGKLR
jgi:hypothetical protein